MKARIALLLALISLPFSLLRADSQSEEWIAKGRAALGAESALKAVKSVHFSGVLDTLQTITDKDGSTRTVPLHLTIDIIFQKPYQQRITLSSEKMAETTGLDDYDGWRRRAEVGGEGKWEMSLLEPTQIKQLRANTWENLAFYSGIEQIGGQVVYQGTEDVGGKSCAKVAFIHSDNIVFTRSFERSTGRLIKTMTDAGGVITEEGEVIVGGVRFPQKLVSKDPSGIVTTITFSNVKVNEVFPVSEFAVPTLGKQ